MTGAALMDLSRPVTELEWAGTSRNGSATPAAPLDTEGPEPWKEPWKKLEPIAIGPPPVQPFSLDLLPDSLRDLVADVAERMQVPLDFPAITTVAALAGSVNRRACIQPKARDTGWKEIPNLWSAIIAAPGQLKSPTISAALAPLNRIQADWRRKGDEEFVAYKIETERLELRISAWKEMSKAAIKNGKAEPERPGELPPRPVHPRLIVNDSTFEAPHATMSENSAGVLVVRDELTGWLGQMDKPGREGERAFCLEAWNGNTGHTMDRIGRGVIHVEACCMSMLGGIQPGRLRSYLVDALKDGPSNDGLIQRFQLLVWPDVNPAWTYVDRAPNIEVGQIVERIFLRLIQLDATNPARFRFDEEAQELFIGWLAMLEAKVRRDDLHPALVAHLSKYRKLMPSLALLFELADRASFDGFDGSLLGNSQNFVTLQHAKLSAQWCEYLESHARRVYSCVVAPRVHAAGELSIKLTKKQIGATGEFSCREVYAKGWSGLDNPEIVKQATELLEDAGWIRELPVDRKPAGGRPSNRFEVNPAVWE